MIGKGLTRGLVTRLGLSLGRKTLGGWSPSSLFVNGQQGAWLDPSDLSTLFQDSAGTTPVTATGQPVGLMKDKSGRGNHASQATTAARPLLQQDTGGRYYLSFDGVDDRLTSVGAGSAALTILQAIQWTTLGTSSFAFGNALAAGGLSLFKASSDVLAVQYGSGSGTANVLPGVTATAIKPNVLGGDTTGSTVRAFCNLAAPVASTVSNPVGSSSCNVGATASGTGTLVGRLYGQLLIGRVLTDAERGNATRYLAARAGVSL